MVQKTRYPREVSEKIAQDLQDSLSPFCERMCIAGSLRRGAPEVGDIELLYIPLVEPSPQTDLLGNPVGSVFPIDEKLEQLQAHGVLAKRPNSQGRYTYGQKNKLMLHVPTGIPVDLFATTSTNWGMSLLVRTGPADFNVKVMSRLRHRGLRGHAYGGITGANSNWEIPCPDEDTVFEKLGMRFIPPERRQ